MEKIKAPVAYKATDSTQLSFEIGDDLNIINKFGNGWWLAETRGKKGLIPATIFSEELPRKDQPYLVTKDYTAKHASQLSVSNGEIVTLIDASSPGWWKVENSSFEKGLVQPSILKAIAKKSMDVDIPPKETLSGYRRLSMQVNGGSPVISGSSTPKFFGAALYRVKTLFTYAPEGHSNPNAKGYELSFKAGEMLDVYQELEQGWLKCRNSNGILGLVPKDYVEKTDIAIDYSSSSSTEVTSKRNDKRRTLTIEADLAKKKPATALYDFQPKEDYQLSFKEGDRLYILSELELGWLLGTKDGKIGHVPAQYVKIEEASPVIPKKMEDSPCDSRRKTIALGERNPGVTVTATAIADYDAKTNLEISFMKGDTLLIMDKLPKGMLRGVTSKGRHGVFPASFVEMNNESSRNLRQKEKEVESDAAAPSSDNSSYGKRNSEIVGKAHAVVDHTASNNSELSFKKGDSFDIFEKNSKGFFKANIKGKTGYVHSSHVELDTSDKSALVEPSEDTKDSKAVSKSFDAKLSESDIETTKVKPVLSESIIKHFTEEVPVVPVIEIAPKERKNTNADSERRKQDAKALEVELQKLVEEDSPAKPNVHPFDDIQQELDRIVQLSEVLSPSRKNTISSTSPPPLRLNNMLSPISPAISPSPSISTSSTSVSAPSSVSLPHHHVSHNSNHMSLAPMTPSTSAPSLLPSGVLNPPPPLLPVYSEPVAPKLATPMTATTTTMTTNPNVTVNVSTNSNPYPPNPNVTSPTSADEKSRQRRTTISNENGAPGAELEKLEKIYQRLSRDSSVDHGNFSVVPVVNGTVAVNGTISNSSSISNLMVESQMENVTVTRLVEEQKQEILNLKAKLELESEARKGFEESQKQLQDELKETNNMLRALLGEVQKMTKDRESISHDLKSSLPDMILTALQHSDVNLKKKKK